MDSHLLSQSSETKAVSARILVVDDDDQLRELIVTLLRKRGYGVEQAATGLKAKSMVDDGKFDVVITDIVMPDMEGLAVVRWLRSRFGAAIKVVAISGGGSDRISYLHHAAKFGADATLAKPFSPPDLLALVEQQVEALRAGAAAASQPATASHI